MNKTLLKLAGVIFLFSVVDMLMIFYQLARCLQTNSPFYCDQFEFAGIFFVMGIPVLILLGISLIILAFSKWYKGDVSTIAKAAIIIFGVIIFLYPYTLYLISRDGPKTYQGFQDRLEQGRLDQEREQERLCEEFRRKMAEYREGQPTMPVLPRGCN